MDQEYIRNILINVDLYQHCFVDGTLCIEDNKDVISITLDETYSINSGEKEYLLDKMNAKLAFNIYKKKKGLKSLKIDKQNDASIKYINK